MLDRLMMTKFYRYYDRETGVTATLVADSSREADAIYQKYTGVNPNNGSTIGRPLEVDLDLAPLYSKEVQDAITGKYPLFSQPDHPLPR